MNASSPSSPTRIAVIGSGPSGFYAAGHLLKALGDDVLVDMFDRLPTPHGLVRSGVAPDHPKIKSVTRVYDKTAALPGFRFFGNVTFGVDVSREELRSRYHAIVYAVGTPAGRKLGIPGEDLPGSWVATDFVGWYNGHPDHRHHDVDFAGRRAVVIGNGNVAIDVARMLMLSAGELHDTDTAGHAVAELSRSSIREVVVVGRRGPAEAAFTNPELIELTQMDDVDLLIEPEGCADATETPEETGPRRNVELLRKIAATPLQGRPKRIVLRFLASPVEVHGEEHVSAVTLCDNELVTGEDGRTRAVAAADRTEKLDASVVLAAIGYVGTPLPDVPFDVRAGVIPNEGGRVAGDDGVLAGEYAVGWVKRGPSGVIGTNKKDAQETVDALLEDLAAGRLLTPEAVTVDMLHEFVRGRQGRHVSYAGWQAIDEHERSTGEKAGRPREKVVDLEEMLAIALESDGA